jgi:uncharacterized coiled-coil protein SlyX
MNPNDLNFEAQISRQNQRLNDLELHTMHMQKDFETLNQVVLEQGKKLDQLLERLKRLTGQLAIVQASMPEAPDEKPPHY